MKPRSADQAPVQPAGNEEAGPDHLEDELAKAPRNGCVGRQVVAENARARIWRTRLAPGERIAFHCHVLDYLFIAVNKGCLVSRDPSGRVERTEFAPGDQFFRHIPAGDCQLRDLENTGHAPVSYLIVEFLGSANEPLPVPDHVRRK